MQFKDAPLATLLVMTEGMDLEVRHTYYVRREGDVPEHLANFVPAFRIATEQGERWRVRGR